MYRHRPDLLGFVNGIPHVLVELKKPGVSVEDAYHGNLHDYKDKIPHLFWYNAITILLNGSQTRVGSMTAPWEHFNEWKKINSEGEGGIVTLDSAIRGVYEPPRLLDIVDNFTMFVEKLSSLQNLVAKNHQ